MNARGRDLVDAAHPDLDPSHRAVARRGARSAPLQEATDLRLPLRAIRHQLFDDAFQRELAGMYDGGQRGRSPVAPALLAMATLLQAARSTCPTRTPPAPQSPTAHGRSSSAPRRLGPGGGRGRGDCALQPDDPLRSFACASSRTTWTVGWSSGPSTSPRAPSSSRRAPARGLRLLAAAGAGGSRTPSTSSGTRRVTWSTRWRAASTSPSTRWRARRASPAGGQQPQSRPGHRLDRPDPGPRGVAAAGRAAQGALGVHREAPE